MPHAAEKLADVVDKLAGHAVKREAA
jgi:hypothetical protein